MRRVMRFARKDLANALRNNMIIYAVLFPLVLSLGLRLFLPSFQSMKPTIAVHMGVSQQVRDELRRYGEIEIFPTMEKVRERVEKPDDVTGIVADGEELVVLLEGNETGEAEEITAMILRRIQSKEPGAEYVHVSMGKDNSAMRNTSAGLLLLSAVLIGSLIVGMNIVDEKETRAVRALAVSPLRMREFMLSHMLLCLGSGVILGLAACFILVGTGADYGKLLAAMTASTGMGLLLGFLIGGIADNLISAIAVLKVIMLLFIGVPIGSLFVPQALQWVFYVFPHYWLFQSYLAVLSGPGYWIRFDLACLAGLLTSSVFVLLLLPFMKRTLKLR